MNPNNILVACQGIYFDGKQYYSKNSRGIEIADTKSNIVLELTLGRGLSRKKRKGEPWSEVDRALHYIQQHHRIPDHRAAYLAEHNSVSQAMAEFIAGQEGLTKPVGPVS